MKPKKQEKVSRARQEALQELVLAAERVSDKFGCHEDGEPSDWSEWVELRRAIQNAKTNGRLCNSR